MSSGPKVLDESDTFCRAESSVSNLGFRPELWRFGGDSGEPAFLYEGDLPIPSIFPSFSKNPEMGFKKVPGEAPEPGSRQAALIAFQVIFLFVALLVYSLRAFTRAFILRSIGSDDYIMGLAVLISIGLAINACVSTKYGWGLHLSAIPDTSLPHILISVWVSELLFTLATSLAKISILIFYLRLAVTSIYRLTIKLSIAFISVWLVTFSCVAIFQCHPPSAFWDEASTTCIDPEIPFFIHGLTNTLTDIYIFILPMKMVWNIHLPKKQKYGLLAIFGAGFLVCIAGILRLYYSITTTSSPDTPWEGYYLWTFESLEINLGIVCASAPYLKSLVTRLVPRLFLSSNRTDNSTPGPQYSSGKKQGGRAGVFWQRNAENGYVLGSVSAMTGKRDSEVVDCEVVDGKSLGGEIERRERVLVAQVDFEALGESPFVNRSQNSWIEA